MSFVPIARKDDRFVPPGTWGDGMETDFTNRWGWVSGPHFFSWGGCSDLMSGYGV